jgi:hypothetical protein
MLVLKVITENSEEIEVMPDRVNPLSYKDLVSDHKNPDKLSPDHARSPVRKATRL